MEQMEESRPLTSSEVARSIQLKRKAFSCMHTKMDNVLVFTCRRGTGQFDFQKMNCSTHKPHTSLCCRCLRLLRCIVC